MSTLRNTLITTFLVLFWSIIPAQADIRLEEQLQALLTQMSYPQKIDLLKLSIQADEAQDIDKAILQIFREQEAIDQEMLLQFATKLSTPSPNPVTTTIKWDKTVHQFGRIVEGTTILYDYKVRNTGNQPLQIKDVNAACPCITAEYPKHPILPNEMATIRVIFDTTKKFGKLSHSIVVWDNSEPHRRTILHLKGEVRAKDNNPGNEKK